MWENLMYLYKPVFLFFFFFLSLEMVFAQNWGRWRENGEYISGNIQLLLLDYTRIPNLCIPRPYLHYIIISFMGPSEFSVTLGSSLNLPFITY